MYVRAPYHEERDDQDFRDFRIGQIESINSSADIATVVMNIQHYDRSFSTERFELSTERLTRCRLLPGTGFTDRSTGRQGQILVCCDDEWRPNDLIEYFVLVDGKTFALSEACIVASATRQDPDPTVQMHHYELHNPSWRHPRELMVESYGELQSATSGMEDLVGSRVVLLAHQAEVIAKALSSAECRFMLADEVGLGKTIEACVIMKALRRRKQDARALIVAPAALVQQWRNELSHKFWLELPVARRGDRVAVPQDAPGLIVSHEDLVVSDSYWEWIQARRWDLLIIDESHQVRKLPALASRLETLSSQIPGVLVLTATPIEQRAQEYLALLRLLDPRRYGRMDERTFQAVLDAQSTIRRKVAYLQPSLTPELFEWEEFSEDAEELLNELAHDELLGQLFAEAQLVADDDEEALEHATKLIAYVSENYRIESRILRSRRATIDAPLPQRHLDDHFGYQPGAEETSVLDELSDYVERYLAGVSAAPLPLEYVRLLLHAAASSPHALLDLLNQRLVRLGQKAVAGAGAASDVSLLVPAPPRREPERVARVVRAAPVALEEQTLIARLVRETQYWHEETERVLRGTKRHDLEAPSQHRMVQGLRAVLDGLAKDDETKLLVFATWPQTLAALLPHLTRIFLPETIAQFTSSHEDEALQEAANRFQSEETCRVLVCDELGGEGRNFQIADQIIHLDLPWTPAQIEQRIGRVDRLGRTGTVTSTVLVAQGSLEQDLFALWQLAFRLFSQSMSGLEIALQEIQAEILVAIGDSVRDGLARLLGPMTRHAEHLRKAVEEERYYEEGAINRRFRSQFQHLSERYRDGSLLSGAILEWSRLAGLAPSFNPKTRIATFTPKHFSVKAIENAKFIPPNMEEARRRSQNRNTLVVKGVFDRDIAVRREDLVFFAPGDDPWTDAIIANAIEADRGRSCAIRRSAPQLQRNWCGFELLFSLQVNPRPLFAAGFDPVHLAQAQGFFVIPTLRVLVGVDGKRIGRSDPIWGVTQRAFDRSADLHLGKREGAPSPLQSLRQRYPAEEWSAMIDAAVRFANDYLTRELLFCEEVAAEAQQELARRATGWEAVLRWNRRHDAEDEQRALDGYRRASAALVEGIKQPLVRLESICFWELQGAKQ